MEDIKEKILIIKNAIDDNKLIEFNLTGDQFHKSKRVSKPLHFAKLPDTEMYRLICFQIHGGPLNSKSPNIKGPYLEDIKDLKIYTESIADHLYSIALIKGFDFHPQKPFRHEIDQDSLYPKAGFYLEQDSSQKVIHVHDYSRESN